MRAIGVIRKIDELGRVVIPKDLRDINGWEPGTLMEIFVTEKGVLFAPYKESCGICGSEEELLSVSNGKICSKCLQEASKQ